MCRAAATAIAALAGGILADRLGGPPVIALAGVVGVGCAVGYALFRTESAGRPAVFGARQAIRALRERPVLSRLAVAQGFYGGGLIAAAPLFALVNVDRLGLSLGMVGVIGILSALATTIAFPIWGAVTDRHGGARRHAHRRRARRPVARRLRARPGRQRPVRGGRPRRHRRGVDRRRHRRRRERPDDARRPIRGDGRLERPDRRARHRGGVPDERPRPDRAGRTSPTGLLLCAVSSLVGVVLFVRTRPGVPVETRAWEIKPGASRQTGAIEAA